MISDPHQSKGRIGKALVNNTNNNSHNSSTLDLVVHRDRTQISSSGSLFRATADPHAISPSKLRSSPDIRRPSLRDNNITNMNTNTFTAKADARTTISSSDANLVDTSMTSSPSSSRQITLTSNNQHSNIKIIHNTANINIAINQHNHNRTASFIPTSTSGNIETSSLSPTNSNSKTLSINTSTAPLSPTSASAADAAAAINGSARVPNQQSPLNRTVTKRATATQLVDKLANLPINTAAAAAVAGGGNTIAAASPTSSSIPSLPGAVVPNLSPQIPTATLNINTGVAVDASSGLATMRKLRDQKLTDLSAGANNKRRTINGFHTRTMSSMMTNGAAGLGGGGVGTQREDTKTGAESISTRTTPLILAVPVLVPHTLTLSQLMRSDSNRSPMAMRTGIEMGMGTGVSLSLSSTQDTTSMIPLSPASASAQPANPATHRGHRSAMFQNAAASSINTPRKN